MNHLPDFYHPSKVGTLYIPDTPGVIETGRLAGLPAADEDAHRIILLLVDPQVDFIHTDGSLSVPGAVQDTCRTIEWLLKHMNEVTTIATSMDSHIPTQIFYPQWWVNQEGQHPAPFTPITSQDVNSGYWQPVFEAQWSLRYVNTLETQAKKELMIWPHHTMIGTPGHSITPALYEAIVYHSSARQSRPLFLTKGMIPKTEHYSLLEPEVKVPSELQGELNVPFLEKLASYDKVYIAGQAKSHCVLETVTSVVRYFNSQPEQLTKWHILSDCMSSVAHPEIDFDAMANRMFDLYAERGLQIVQSSDPIA